MMETSSRGQTGRGLWNCPRGPQYSKDTQEMLKLMMQESRLTNFQQRQINDKLKKGAALPLTCNPTSSAPPQQPKPQTIKSASVRGSTKSQRRSAEKCSSGDNYTRELFRPSVTRDLEKEKRRLQNILATGQEEPKPSRPRNTPLALGPEGEGERDRFQEGEVDPKRCVETGEAGGVLGEIEERKQFLEEMSSLGKGKQYFNLINTEISQKVRELEVIDKARCAELRTLMTSEKTTEPKMQEAGAHS